MSESLTNQWKVTKQAVRGKGVVVAQNSRAAQAGAEILRKGGNAIDAAVATGMAIGAHRAVDERHRRRRLHDHLERQGAAGLDDRLRPDLGQEARPRDLQDRRPRPGQSLRLARHPRAEERGRLSLDRRARHGRRPRQGAGALRQPEVAGRDGAGHRARQARHGTRLVHAGHAGPGRARPRQVPGLARRLSVRRRPRADDRLAGQRPLPQARQSRRDLSAAVRRRSARILRRQPGARHRRRPAGRRLGHLLRRSCLLRGAHRRAAVVPARRRHHQCRGRPHRRADARVARSSLPARRPRAGAPPMPTSSSPSPRACTRPTRSG